MTTASCGVTPDSHQDTQASFVGPKRWLGRWSTGEFGSHGPQSTAGEAPSIEPGIALEHSQGQPQGKK